MENVVTLSKLIGLLLFCPPPHCFDFDNSKNTRNELARPVMGTIFLVFDVRLFWTTMQLQLGLLYVMIAKLFLSVFCIPDF